MESIRKAAGSGRGPSRAVPGLGDTAASVDRSLVVGWALLIVAAAFVGVAIALDSSSGRALNGVGGIVWLAGAVMLVRLARRNRPVVYAWLVLGIAVVALSSLLSPRDLGAAWIGFFVGGWIVALVARPATARLSMVGLLPALWLPTHLGVAAVRALYRQFADQPSVIRTDPPPTAALVPLAMVLAALVGGVVGAQLTRRREERVALPTASDHGAR